VIREFLGLRCEHWVAQKPYLKRLQSRAHVLLATSAKRGASVAVVEAIGMSEPYVIM